MILDYHVVSSDANSVLPSLLWAVSGWAGEHATSEDTQTHKAAMSAFPLGNISTPHSLCVGLNFQKHVKSYRPTRQSLLKRLHLKLSNTFCGLINENTLHVNENPAQWGQQDI